jgi:hypothetical protein
MTKETKETIHQVALRRARDLAGGVTYLSHQIGVRANDLDDFIHGKERVPEWLFLRVIDYLQAGEEKGITPPGFPENWRDGPLPRA